MNSNSMYDEEAKGLLDDFNNQLAHLEARYSQAMMYIAAHGVPQPNVSPFSADGINHTSPIGYVASSNGHQKFVSAVAAVAAFVDIPQTVRTANALNMPLVILRALTTPIVRRSPAAPGTLGETSKSTGEAKGKSEGEGINASKPRIIEGTFHVVSAHTDTCSAEIDMAQAEVKMETINKAKQAGIGGDAEADADTKRIPLMGRPLRARGAGTPKTNYPGSSQSLPLTTSKQLIGKQGVYHGIHGSN